MKKMYIVWNLTNYNDGYEFLGLYHTKANAEKAYRKHIKELYGTTNEDELLDIWEGGDTGCVDSWRVEPIYVND